MRQRTNPGAGAPGRAGDPQWGLLVRTTNDGRTQLFEKDLGGGRKVFTFVIWANAESDSLDDDH